MPFYGVWNNNYPMGRALVHGQKRASCSKSAAGLLAWCHQADIRMRCIACSGLMITSLLQVVNRLAASWLSRLFIHKLVGNRFNNVQQVCKYHVCNKSDFHNVMKSTDLLQLVDNLEQTGIINNLRQSFWLCTTRLQENNVDPACISNLFQRWLNVVKVIANVGLNKRNLARWVQCVYNKQAENCFTLAGLNPSSLVY